MLIRKQKYIDLVVYATLLLDSEKKTIYSVSLELYQNPLVLPLHTYVHVNKMFYFYYFKLLTDELVSIFLYTFHFDELPKIYVVFLDPPGWSSQHFVADVVVLWSLLL